MHLHLIDAIQPVLDWVFDGDDVRLARLHASQGGIQGGGLPRPRGPGHQHHPLWQRQQLFDPVTFARPKAEAGEVREGHPSVEHANDGLLPLCTEWQRGDPQVDGPALKQDRGAAILRPHPVGDVETRHDFQAADQVGGDFFRKRGDVVQHAVNAVPHQQGVVVGLEMDIAHLRVERVHDHRVERFDRAAAHGGRDRLVPTLGHDPGKAARCRAPAFLAPQAGAVGRLLSGADFTWSGDGQGDSTARREFKISLQVGQQRVGAGKLESPVPHAERHDAIAHRQGTVEQDGVVRSDFTEVGGGMVCRGTDDVDELVTARPSGLQRLPGALRSRAAQILHRWMPQSRKRVEQPTIAPRLASGASLVRRVGPHVRATTPFPQL